MKKAKWYIDEGKLRFRCSKCMKDNYMQLTPEQIKWYEKNIKQHKCEDEEK